MTLAVRSYSQIADSARGGIRAEREAGGMQIVLFGAPRYSYRTGARAGEAHRTRLALLVHSDCHNHLRGVRGEGTRALFSACPRDL